jgi:hypothetical protein
MTDYINQNIFYFGGQGVCTLILIWANASQLISAKYFSITLKKYQALVSYSMNMTKVIKFIIISLDAYTGFLL